MNTTPEILETDRPDEILLAQRPRRGPWYGLKVTLAPRLYTERNYPEAEAPRYPGSPASVGESVVVTYQEMADQERVIFMVSTTLERWFNYRPSEIFTENVQTWIDLEATLSGFIAHIQWEAGQLEYGTWTERWNPVEARLAGCRWMISDGTAWRALVDRRQPATDGEAMDLFLSSYWNPRNDRPILCRDLATGLATWRAGRLHQFDILARNGRWKSELVDPSRVHQTAEAYSAAMDVVQFRYAPLPRGA